ncbi:MAG: hypothetical protein DPW09_41845 [Anaerolineae bacterium]|nr:hypothetical protein [Anaerolineae bacterium]
MPPTETLLIEHLLDWPVLGFTLALVILFTYRHEIKALSQRAGKIKIGQVEVDLAQAFQQQNELIASDTDELRRQIEWLARQTGQPLPVVVSPETDLESASSVPVSTAESNFETLCDEYTTRSSQLDFGQKRSFAYTLSEASQEADFSPQEFLVHGNEGHVLGAALWLQTHPDSNLLGDIIVALHRISSAFVRFRLVEALEALLPHLDDNSCRHLARALQRLITQERLDDQLALRIGVLLEQI